jgi:hypothetical protein
MAILCKLGINKCVSMVTDDFVVTSEPIGYMCELSIDRPLFYPNLLFLNSVLIQTHVGYCCNTIAKRIPRSGDMMAFPSYPLIIQT